MQVVQIGNFEPPYSTENDLLRTMREMGVEVDPMQEQDRDRWFNLLESVRHGIQIDLILWTRTKSLSDQVPNGIKRAVQIEARLRGIRVVGFHLDRWWGLSRETDLYEDPFFRCEKLFTADGHHEAHWDALGVNHVWSPPAIAPHNVVSGRPRREFRSDIAFVGSWRQYGHTEWAHRGELVLFLKRHYGKRVRFWPAEGHPAVRGQDLADLYASVKIVVGDSCLVPGADGRPMTRYCSDRVYETIGRGGFLIHPHVEGITSGHDFESLPNPALRSDEHLVTWSLGDWDDLGAKIEWALGCAHTDDIAKQGQAFVARHHTYRERLTEVFRQSCTSAWIEHCGSLEEAMR